MRQTRHILAVALVATALCADRSAMAAAPTARTPSAGVAARLVSSLTVRFQRVMPGVKLVQLRAERFDAAAPAGSKVENRGSKFARLSVFDLRSSFVLSLPPPSLS